MKLFSKSLPFFVIVWRNTVEPGRPQLKIWRMGIVYRVSKAKNTQSEYVIFIAFPMQQWLHERISLLRYTHPKFRVLLLAGQYSYPSILSQRFH